MLVFRNCEVTSGCGSPAQCPNQFCFPGQAAVASNSSVIDSVLRAHGKAPSNTDATYTTLVWLYDWPAAPVETTPAATGLDDCLRGLQQMQAQGHLDSSAAEMVLAAVVQAEAGSGLGSLCASSGRVGGDAVVARLLVRMAQPSPSVQ